MTLIREQGKQDVIMTDRENLDKRKHKRSARADAIPNFFIVGAPKCATTAMDSYLAAHPEIMLAISDDGGQTFRNLPNRKLGRIGRYDWRAFWVGLGSARQRVYRAAVSDPVKVVVSDTVLDVDGGRL